MCVCMSPPGTVTRLPVMGKDLHVHGDGAVCVCVFTGNKRCSLCGMSPETSASSLAD